jgi:hypothetical protein
LNTRENELDRVYTQLRKETSRRREIEEEMGNLREDLKLSMQENQSLRTRQDNNRPGQSTSAAVTAAAGPSRSGNTAATTTNSLPADFGFQMINALKEATAAAGVNGARQSNLVELYPCQMTINKYYQSLPEPWDVTIPEYGPIKELHKVRFTQQQRFSGDRLWYAAWRRRFLAVVHTQNAGS